MELALKQVADFFGVSENRIIKWIKSENLPSDLVADQYRFHRAELLEWAAFHGYPFSPAIYAAESDDLTPAGTHVSDALQSGGVLENVSGSSLREVLKVALNGLPLPATMSPDVLIELFLSRETVGSSAVGNGIAIPHPREPVLLNVPAAVMRLCYLSQPLSMSTPDNRPVTTLFVLICPTAHEHLQMLSRLGALLRVDTVQEALQKRQTGEPLFRILRDAGSRFHEAQQLTSEAN
ncbi:MAG: PTS sugar transporter subunit IIA [Planctomycetaceae bacterium]